MSIYPPIHQKPKEIRSYDRFLIQLSWADLYYRQATRKVIERHTPIPSNPFYDYPLLWYQTHLQEDGVVLRSPYLPDHIARYQGIQHYLPVGFFGGEEGLEQRQELDRVKKQRCEEFMREPLSVVPERRRPEYYPEYLLLRLHLRQQLRCFRLSPREGSQH